MGEFLNLPIEASTLDGRNFTLLKPLMFRLNDGRTFRAIIGAQSDGASTPRGSWNAVPPFGLYFPAAYAHDAGYRSYTEELMSGAWGSPDTVWHRIQLPKPYCDAMFQELMLGLGVNASEAFGIYTAVKYGGDQAYSDDLAQPIPNSVVK